MLMSHPSLVNASTPLQNAIARLWEKWRSSMESEELGEEHCAAALDEMGYETGSEEEVCESLVDRWAKPLIERARGAFTEQFSDEERRAFELGEWVDQGIRPHDVHRFMYRPPRVDPKKTGAEVRAHHVGRRKRDIANYMPKPGELAPSRFWSLRLPTFCADAGIPNAIPESLHLSPESTREQILSFVEEVDRRIREKLAESGEEARCIGNIQERQGPRTQQAEELDTALHSEGSHQTGPASHEVAEEMSPGEFQRLRKLKKRIDPKDEYIGDSLVILRVFERIAEFNKSPNDPILILGPRGSGKTEIAKRIHSSSDRKEKKFRALSATDAMAHDEAFARQKLLGYGPKSLIPDSDEKGSPGLLKEAEGGTVFIDEVADLPEWFQLLLFPVLDGKEVHLFAGKGTPFIPNVRLIFATNRDLSEYMIKERFRDDFFGRIKHNLLSIPPLSGRREDVFSFVRSRCGEHRPTEGFLLCLLRYSWPDNVRELLHVLRKAVAKTSSANEPLVIEHIELGDMSVVEGVRAMPDTEKECEVYRFLAQVLERQGFEKRKKGQALYARMAEVLQTSQSTVSRKAEACLQSES